MKSKCILAVLCFFFVSCAAVQPAKEKPRDVKPVEIASPVIPQLEREKRIEPPEGKDLYSLSLRDADVRDVLRALARQSNYNVVIEPDVKGICTVDLKDVTLRKALEYALEPLNYAFKIEEKTIYVSKPKLEMAMFTLNYLDLRKVGTSSVITSSGGTTGPSISGGTGGITTTGAQTLSVNIRSETESDIWKSLDENLKNMLSKDGKVIINRQTLTVLVTDYPANLKSITMFLDRIESVLHQQVLIEAKILEVQLTETSRQGVNWQYIAGQSGRIGDITFKSAQQFLNPNIVVSPSTAATAATPYFRFFVGSNFLDIDNTFIDLLKTQGTVNIISSPKIAALNNQRAVIKVATQDVYFEEQQTTGTTTSVATYTPRFITVGLTLDVISHIDDSGNVILNIHPVLTEKVSTAKSPDGSEVPILDVRETDTMVRIREGETVIIAGLIKDTKIMNKTGVPWLMDLPLIGKIFRLNEEDKSRTELIVFLTPRVIRH